MRKEPFFKKVLPQENNKMEKHVQNFLTYLTASGTFPRTLEHYRCMLKFFSKFLKEQKITDPLKFTAENAAAFQSYVFNYISRFDRPLALSSQSAYLDAVKVFYDYLVKSEAIAIDPTTVIHLPKERRKLPRNILSSAEVKRMLKQPDLSTLLGYRDRAMLELSHSCGLRVNEIMELKCHNLNLNTHTSARTSDNKTLLGGELSVTGKGGKTRVIPVGKSAAFFSAEYIKNVRPKLNKRNLDIMFLTRGGKMHDRSGLIRKFKQFAKSAKIKKTVTPHTFRHTLATEMLKNGADLRYIQEILGHEKLATTQVYLQVVKKELINIHKTTHPREQIDLPENAIEFRK